MERIKLAIEKAKAGLQDSADSAISPIRADPPTARKEKPALRVTERAAPASAPIAVQYTETTVVPLDENHLASKRVVAHQKTHPAAWSFDVLRTQVLQKMDENGWKTIAITSPSVESGKTLISTNLAISISQMSNRTVLLVDFDFRRPSVAKTLGIECKTSLNDVLSGDATVAEALVNPGMERFVVLPTNRSVPNASEMLSSAKVGHLIGEMRDRYRDRIVIFDLPPMLVADDVMTLLPRIDCVLLVVASGASTEGEIEETMNRLAKANLLGVVMNKEDAPVPNAYY